MINEVKKETWKRKSSGAIIEVVQLYEGVFRACPTTVSSGYEGKWEDGTAR